MGMGIKEVFDEEKADLSGINGKRNLAVSRVIQEAFIDVNEEGSEASAATSVIINWKTMGPKREIFKCSHPFMFMIIDNEFSNIIFAGNVMHPTSIQDRPTQEEQVGNGNVYRSTFQTFFFLITTLIVNAYPSSW